ncbi:hypothetical protein NL676_007202 [Syzygium grande]|nr:hypothetical protein NL676_007202 [Syzygium grande]
MGAGTATGAASLRQAHLTSRWPWLAGGGSKGGRAHVGGELKGGWSAGGLRPVGWSDGEARRMWRKRWPKLACSRRGEEPGKGRRGLAGDEVVVSVVEVGND